MNRYPSATGEAPYNTNDNDSNVGRSSVVAATSVSRGDSTGSDRYVRFTGSSSNIAGPSNHNRHPSDAFDSIANYRETGPLDLPDEDDEYWDEEDDEDDESSFIDFSLLSHIAVQLRDKVPRGTHVKGSIPYPRAFTGKDIVVGLVVTSNPFSWELMVDTCIVNDPVTNPA